MNYLKYIALVGIVLMTAIMGMALYNNLQVMATNTPFKVICHHTPGNDVTLSFQNLQSYLGHYNNPHSWQVYDTNGPCVTPSPTPSLTPVVSPTPEVTPTITPIEDPCGELEVKLLDVVQEPCPTPTPEPEQPLTQAPNNTTAPSGPVCEIRKPIVNFHVENPVPNDGTLTLKWWPMEGVDKLNLEYGLEPGKPLWGQTNIPNSGEYEVKDLTNGTHYWFRLNATDGCTPTDWFDPEP